MKHAFEVGDIVTFHSSISRHDEGPYLVTRQMPADGPEPAYRLKDISDSRERVAREHELRASRQGAGLTPEPHRSALKPARTRPTRRST
ncbi:hypothetical protein C5L14_20200 [Labrys okinawensis]|uniref:Uncharacterized protein n=1 Tax=Labrys okinawensis TaxID=346911 RepID=A0A2S9Q933_9HYPH|nr:hypothetical protein C5L14_20200 [Labrys okinawensis]